MKYTGGQTNNEGRAIYRGQTNNGGREVYRGSIKYWREGSIQRVKEKMECEQYKGGQTSNGGSTVYRGSIK